MSEQKNLIKAGYYDGFHCKGGECRFTCCQQWHIAVNEQDYHRIMEMECSPELRSKFDKAFREPEKITKDRFREIAHNSAGLCPMLDRDGLCMIQKECGGSAIPEVCREYPRKAISEKRYRKICCSAGCEQVVETLMNAEKLEVVYSNGFQDALQDESMVEVRALFDSLRILQDRSKPLEERIAILCGASLFEDREKMLADSLRNLKGLGNIAEQSREFVTAAAHAAERYAGENGYGHFCEDVTLFDAKYPRWQVCFENLLANHMLLTGYPYVDPKLKPTEARTGLQNIYAFLRILSASYTREKDGMTALADFLAVYFRHIESTRAYHNLRDVVLFNLFHPEESCT